MVDDPGETAPSRHNRVGAQMNSETRQHSRGLDNSTPEVSGRGGGRHEVLRPSHSLGGTSVGVVLLQVRIFFFWVFSFV